MRYRLFLPGAQGNNPCVRLCVIIFPFIIFCSLFTDVYGVTVDIYQYTGSGTPGDMLTPAVMNSSSIGGCGSVPATWRVDSNGDGMHVSSNYARPLPGIVTVGTMTCHGMGGSRTWVTRTDIDQSFVWGEFNPGLLHSRMTIACFFTTEPRTGAASSDFALDIINVGYPASESDPKATYSVIQMHLHNADPMKLRTHGFTGISSAGPGIAIEARKTYWINLHHDGLNGKQKIAIYDPDMNYAPVGPGIEINDTKVNPIEGFIKIGRVDTHGYTGSRYWLYDGVADTNGQSYTYFSHIMIDFTEAKFPLLPDIDPAHTRVARATAQRPVSAWYAGGKIHLQSGPGLRGVGVFDIQGRTLFVWKTGGDPAGTVALPVRRSGPGLYLIDAADGGGHTALSILAP